MNSKGGIGMVLMAALISLFIFAVVFVVLLPMFQGFSDKVDPLVEGTEFDDIRISWTDLLYRAPLFGFIFIVVWIVLRIVRGRMDNDYVSGGGNF